MGRILDRFTVRHWMFVAVINFLIVGGYGLLMRLKFLFPLPWANQKFLMHAHSHFAFTGWISHALMILIVMAMLGLGAKDRLPVRYQWVVFLNVLISLGMLFSFTWQGYGLLAIVCSSLSIFLSYAFAVLCWKDLRVAQIPDIVKCWFRAALVFSVLSSLGTFALVYLRITQLLEPLNQLASVYFYLHFQYNGWFFFSCIGLLNYWIYKNNYQIPYLKLFFWLYAGSTVPAYFLSVLWWKGFPTWLYIVLVATVVLQIVLWSFYMRYVYRIFKRIFSILHEVRLLWFGVMLAVFLKLSLQAASVVPSLSKLVYGYRPIVIAYLHLVLLVIISLFILGYAFQSRTLIMGRMTRWFLSGLVVGVLLNELVLMVQGIGGLTQIYIEGTNQMLAFAALLIVFSILGILVSQKIKLGVPVVNQT